LTAGRDAAARQPSAQRLVDGLLEGPARAALLRLGLGGGSSSRVRVVRMFPC
jgi:hypothetical protein